MRKRGKKFTAARAAIPADRNYSIEEAVPLMQKVKFAKFDETVELALRLGVDPKHADQMVRGTVVLPQDRKSTRLNSSHSQISYAVFCLKKKNTQRHNSHAARDRA